MSTIRTALQQKLMRHLSIGGNVPLRTPQISAGSPDDLRAALLYIRTRYPDAPLYAVGFSLGGTVLSKYLGQEGESSEIRAGCVVACVSSPSSGRIRSNV